MPQLLELVEKRAEHEALKEALMAHGRVVMDCRCWHDDPHGVYHLKERLILMVGMAARLEETLADIHRIEQAVFSR